MGDGSGADLLLGVDWLKPVHQVTVSSFYMDTTLVTQEDYERLTGNNPAFNLGDKRRPIERNSWFDAVLYCNLRSKSWGLDTMYTYTGLEGYPGRCTNLVNLKIDYSKHGIRLPSESEWEYACRGGTTGLTWFNPTEIDKYDWNKENSGGTSHPVALKPPNPFGLYDINGNVFEMVNDSLGPYPSSPQVDPRPLGWPVKFRIHRGGSWSYTRTVHTSVHRYRNYPWDRSGDDGFRCVCDTSVGNNLARLRKN